VLPKRATVHVAELNPVVERWCRGPLAKLTENAVADPRVSVLIGDVMQVVRKAAKGPVAGRYDAIIVDLYVGPADAPRGQEDPLYGPSALRATAAALTGGGVYAVWSEEPNSAFEQRLARLGFKLSWERNRGGGPRHAVYVAQKGMH